MWKILGAVVLLAVSHPVYSGVTTGISATANNETVTVAARGGVSTTAAAQQQQPASTQAPLQQQGTTKAPGVAQSQAPAGSTTQVPVQQQGTTKAPGAAQSQAPAGSTQAPGAVQTQAPGVSTTRAPAGQTQAPAGSTTPAPGAAQTQAPGASTTKTPAGQTQAPAGPSTTKAPAGQTQAPIGGQTQAPGASTTKVPAAQTVAPQATVANNNTNSSVTGAVSHGNSTTVKPIAPLTCYNASNNPNNTCVNSMGVCYTGYDMITHQQVYSCTPPFGAAASTCVSSTGAAIANNKCILCCATSMCNTAKSNDTLSQECLSLKNTGAQGPTTHSIGFAVILQVAICLVKSLN